MIEDQLIVAEDIWRTFGSFPALQGASFRASAGDVTGLVGPNGAGKTTLLLILGTLLSPDRGVVRVGGHDPMTEPLQARKILGWVPDAFGFYDNLKVHEYLVFAGEARRLPASAARARAHEVLELVRLEQQSASPVHVLSRGQKQRLAFASALVHRPRVLLLDEPAAGLDPVSRAELLDLVRRLANDGAAVVISSHQLSDLESVADRVVFVDRGTTVGEHLIADSRRSALARRWRIRALDDDALTEALSLLQVSALRAPQGGADVVLETEEAVAQLISSLVRSGVAVVSCAPVESQLEATYFELMDPEGPGYSR
jgi:ABC-2 type transport system ATP-binding protein